MKNICKIFITGLATMASQSIFAGSYFSYPINIRLSSDTVKAVVVDSFKLRIIPPSTGVQFYKDGIIFLSHTKDERKMASNHLSFGNTETFFSNINDSVTGRHILFSSSGPFPYPSEAVTFSSDYKKIYFTGLPKKGLKEKIFVANLVHDPKTDGEIISNVTQLDLCKDDSRCSHPALSNNDSILVFASDMNGAGGMDLFISHWEDSKWSDPMNMGKEINTKGNEYSPYLDSENNLYFSSDKLPGHGGFDIFTCRYNADTWDKPVNMTGINSSRDEVSFTMNKADEKTAFFTRKISADKMQLFKVRLAPETSAQNLIEVFNSKPVLHNPTALKIDSVKLIPEKNIAVIPAAENKKDVAAVIPETSQVVLKEKTPSLANAVIIKPTLSLSSDLKDVVLYRVQIFATSKPKTDKEIMVSGKRYQLYEYFYLNAYRYTIGEFRTLQPAVELQKLCRQQFPQAFVAAFMNDTRSVTLK